MTISGFNNGTMYATNVDFRGNPNVEPQVSADGQLLIGSSISPFLAPALLTSSDGSIQFTLGHNTIDMKSAGGAHPPVQTLSDDINTQVTPSGNNIQLTGHVVNQTGQFSTTVSSPASHLIAVNPMSSARWIVDSKGFNGTHTTIASALTSATSGDTIFIMPGTYTENLTMKAGVNLSAWDSDGYTGNVIINGNITASYSGTASISGIQLKTNSTNCLTISGANATTLYVSNCYINCTNNTGISITNNNAASQAFFVRCNGNLATTGITYFASSGAVVVDLDGCLFLNTGSSLTVNTFSAGAINIYNSFIVSGGFTTSGTASISGLNSNIGNVVSGGSGSNILNMCVFGALAANSGIFLDNCVCDTVTTPPITGSSTVTWNNLGFRNGGGSMTTTTQTPLLTMPGAVKVTAPGAYPYTVLGSDYVIIVDSSSARTINLTASPATGQTCVIKDNVGSAAANNITITPAAGNIDGAANYKINTNYGSVTLVYNSTQWNLI